MVKLQGILCWWCCANWTCWAKQKSDHSSEELKDTSAVSEPQQKPEDDVNQLRLEVKQMMCQRQASTVSAAEVEDVVVGVDYLPVYKEQSGQLSFIGVKLKVAFTEERRKQVVSMQ